MKAPNTMATAIANTRTRELARMPYDQRRAAGAGHEVRALPRVPAGLGVDHYAGAAGSIPEPAASDFTQEMARRFPGTASTH